MAKTNMMTRSGCTRQIERLERAMADMENEQLKIRTEIEHKKRLLGQLTDKHFRANGQRLALLKMADSLPADEPTMLDNLKQRLEAFFDRKEK